MINRMSTNTACKLCKWGDECHKKGCYFNHSFRQHCILDEKCNSPDCSYNHTRMLCTRSLEGRDCNVARCLFRHTKPGIPAQVTENRSSTPPAAVAQPRLVGVFWDIENCAVPKGKSAVDIILKIRQEFILKRNHRENEFVVAANTSNLPHEVQFDIDKAGGVKLFSAPGGRKNSADRKLKQSMEDFVYSDQARQAEREPKMLIMCTADIDFVDVLRRFQMNKGAAIILLHSKKCSDHFKKGWNELYSFEEFCRNLPTAKVPPAGNHVPYRNGYSGPQSSTGFGSRVGQHGSSPSVNPVVLAPVEVFLTVAGLQTSLDNKMLRLALQGQISNLGTVANVQDGEARIDCKTVESAEAAKKLLQSSEIFGSSTVRLCQIFD